VLKTVSIIVTGKVQGVFYRQSTKEKARELKITGEVRNMSDGSVHIIATGYPEQLDQLIKWCKTGPPKSIVEETNVNDLPMHEYDGFMIKR
jgi:acylphosphatase